MTPYIWKIIRSIELLSRLDIVRDYAREISKARSDHCNSNSQIEVASFSNEENHQLSERYFEDISKKIENKFSKRLRDAEFGQREVLRLIENLSSKVDSLSSATSEQACSTSRSENSENV